MPRRALIACGAGSALLCLLAGTARADASGARWWVVTEGESCRHERSELEREIVLACGAVGGTCRIVHSIGDAELVATLRCPGEDVTWTLETTTANGHYVGSIDLGGSREDRLRQAAMEVARDEAPERTLVANALENALTTTRERDVAPDKPAGTRKLDLTLGGAAGLGGGGSSHASEPDPGMAGGRAAAGLKLGAPTTLFLGTSILTNFYNGTKARRMYRAGAGFAVGAPFVPTSVVGGSIELGLDVTEAYGPGRAPGIVASPRTTAGFYGRTAFILQIPLRGIRPFFGLSWALTDTTRVETTADVGLLVPILQ
jgi:hypothetical protein